MIVEWLQSLVTGCDLNRDEAIDLMRLIMRGEATDAQLGALLTALRIKGESVSEIAAFATVMRENAVTVNAARYPLLDTCGTGGSSFRVFNVSTAAAFVAAAAGVGVAKHGNRAASGVCGSADVLEALGVNIDISPEQCAECIDTVGIGFLFARSHHPAMKHVGAVRREIGVRTVFNLLGPLTNPAGATRQVLGVYDASLCPVVAGALRELGSERAIVVHAEPGLDELSTFSMNHVCELINGVVTESSISPAELGCADAPPDTRHLLPASTPHENALMLRQSLGEGANSTAVTARRDIVAVNAAAAVRAGGAADSWHDAAHLAGEIISSGAALSVLDRLIALTSSFASSKKAVTV